MWLETTKLLSISYLFVWAMMILLSSNISSSFVRYSICSCTDVERHLRVFSQEVFEISPLHMCAAVSTYKV